MPGSLHDQISKAAAFVSRKTTPSNDERLKESVDIDDEIRSTLAGGGKVNEISGTKKSSDVNWEMASSYQARYIGGGRFGRFVEMPDGTGVKTGMVTRDEVDMLKKAGEAGAGPRLIAARLLPGSGEVRGQVSMEILRGRPIVEADSENGGVKKGDSYTRAMANLHRIGIAHRDPHQGNIIVNEKGEAKFVDFGLAIASWPKTLKEAIMPKPGDSLPTSKEVRETLMTNVSVVRDMMIRDKLITWQDRYPDWSAIPEAKAKEYVEKIYEGI